MKAEGRAYLISACLHLAVAGATVAGVTFPKAAPAPVPVDVTLLPAVRPDGPAQGGNPGTTAPAALHARRSLPVPVLPLPALRETVPDSPTAPPEVMSTAPEAAPVVVAALPETANAAPGPAVVTMAAAGPVSSPSGRGNGGSGAGEGLDLAGTGSGTRGESIESLREGYIRKNYGYIRDLINSNLRYPGRARRMGWSGALRVEFLVLEDGSVRAIRVAKSSGVPLLDRNAEDTVRRSAPFPRPPVSARLVIPVEYVLE